MNKISLYLSALALIPLAACQPMSTPEPRASQTTNAILSKPTPQPSLTPTSSPTTAPAATLTAPPPNLEICSPLADIPLDQIPSIIHNPFHPPIPGSDDPHQGVDLADVDPQTRLALEGRQVQVVLAGQVSSIVEDRFPYGNAILVETPLDRLSTHITIPLSLPTLAPTLSPHPSLTCPDPEPSFVTDNSERSLYLLYAHLKDPSTLTSGDEVGCGQTIGKVGMTGNALNPHLHLEARVGPASLRFESLAHYTSSAKDVEMAAYCIWRVSGLFQLIDPIKLLSLTSQTR